MEDVFQFEIGLGYASDVIISVEIPMELHDRISQYVGEGQLARFEFGFHFQEVIQRQFPKLDMMIHEKIDEWRQQHYGLQYPDHMLHLYGLFPPCRCHEVH